MEKEKAELLDESIKLEKNMADLYLFYQEKFAEDKEFWQKLSEEEKNHASIVRFAKEFFGKFPNKLVYHNLGELKTANKIIKNTIEKYKKQLPSKEEAYKCAIDLENSAYELHYQNLTLETSDSDEIILFQNLNKEDKNHAIRIEELLTKKG